MGTLVIKALPAWFSGSPVDHTYVECGTGRRGWSCFGRKTGGRVVAIGTGSTQRADAIAQPNERANMRCYGISGVCHQAANRIAFPAGILAIGARGYGLSEGLYGPYGRPHGPLGSCASPFVQYPQVSGDLQECAEPADGSAVQQASAMQFRAPPGQEQYIKRVLEIYDTGLRPLQGAFALSERQREELGVRLFLNKVEFNLGNEADRMQSMLEQVYRDFDRRRAAPETAFLRQEISASQFAEDLNRRALEFQHKVAGSVRKEHYTALMDLPPEQFVDLVDPSMVEQAYKTP